MHRTPSTNNRSVNLMNYFCYRTYLMANCCTAIMKFNTGSILVFLSLSFASCSDSKSMAQDQPFNTALNSLFFGVQISDTSSSLIKSLRKIPKLSYKEPTVRQRNLNTSIDFGSDAWSSRHIFTFSESPVQHLKIKIRANLFDSD